MSICSYFGRVDKPNSEIVRNLNNEEIILTEREVEEVTSSLASSEEAGKKRGKYKKLTTANKIEIGKEAHKYGVSMAIRRLEKKYPGLSKQTVSDYKKKHVAGEIDTKKKETRGSRPSDEKNYRPCKSLTFERSSDIKTCYH